MFEKTIVRCALAVALAAMLGGSAMAGFTPPTGLAPGSQYQVLFVTADGTAAQSSDIADYNSFVQNEASLSPTFSPTTWTAVVSTLSINALQATNTTDIPIYDTQGNLLEPNFPSLFTDQNFAGPAYDQFGNQCPVGTNVWTGSWSDGLVDSSYPMGTAPGMIFNGGATVAMGKDGVTAAWFNWPFSNDWPWHSLPLYAVSATLSVPVPVPEPGTLTLLVSALLGLAGARHLRRRGARA